MGVTDRLRRLEKTQAAKRPPGFVWAAVLTETAPGVYAFDFPERLRGKTATREEIDRMRIPMILCDFLNGNSKGWRN